MSEKLNYSVIQEFLKDLIPQREPEMQFGETEIGRRVDRG